MPSSCSSEIEAQADEARDLIAKYGFYIQHIEPSVDNLRFSYTVGLPQYLDHPEIFAMSLPKDVTLYLFNVIVEKINRGDDLSIGKVLDDVSNLPCMLIPADNKVRDDLPLEAVELCTGLSDYDVVQLVWSDQQSRFPHHPNFDASLRHLQPVFSNVSILM